MNRIDNVITFKELSIDGIEPIANIILDEVRERLADRQIKLEVTHAALDSLAIDGFDPVYGARPLKRLIQKVVVDRIAEKIVNGEVEDGATITIDVADDDYKCTVEN